MRVSRRVTLALPEITQETSYSHPSPPKTTASEVGPLSQLVKLGPDLGSQSSQKQKTKTKTKTLDLIPVLKPLLNPDTVPNYSNNPHLTLNTQGSSSPSSTPFLTQKAFLPALLVPSHPCTLSVPCFPTQSFLSCSYPVSTPASLLPSSLILFPHLPQASPVLILSFT